MPRASIAAFFILSNTPKGQSSNLRKQQIPLTHVVYLAKSVVRLPSSKPARSLDSSRVIHAYTYITTMCSHSTLILIALIASTSLAVPTKPTNAFTYGWPQVHLQRSLPPGRSPSSRAIINYPPEALGRQQALEEWNRQCLDERLGQEATAPLTQSLPRTCHAWCDCAVGFEAGSLEWECCTKPPAPAEQLAEFDQLCGNFRGVRLAEGAGMSKAPDGCPAVCSCPKTAREGTYWPCCFYRELVEYVDGESVPSWLVGWFERLVRLIAGCRGGTSCGCVL